MSTEAQTYDQVPFPNQAVPPSDPDRLAAIATLFGMRPQRVDRARLLELGCASGGNLLPLAERFPESTFIGTDFSHGQIATARRGAELLGLKNIELRAASIMDLDESLGQFDYIIAHGFYSWVSPDVQEQMLKLTGQLLAPQGVAYASYNTYPGWCLPNIVRAMVCGYTSPEAPIQLRLSESRKLLQFFSAALNDDPTPYARLLKSEIDRVLASEDGYVAHEHLGENNEPVYFHEFVERAAKHGLQYVGDSLLHTMFGSILGAEVEARLMPLVHDAVSVEQHIDLVQNRAFRMSLLCHADIPLVRRLGPECLEGLYVAGRFRRASAETQPGSEDHFFTPDGAVIGTSSPVVKAALDELGRRWPSSVSVEELRSIVAQTVPAADPSAATAHREGLDRHLMESLRAGYLELRSRPDHFTSRISTHPTASPLAREQARISPRVTNRRHEMVSLDEISQNLLRYLDGQRDREGLLSVLHEAVDRGQLAILVNGVPIREHASATNILTQVLDRSLALLAADSLLVA
jgi:methyltransferase-like protein/trans-aconitate methyltransferase